jgi:hypothetical protein
MAKKARLYVARLRDGHGENNHVFPAQSKDSLLNQLDLPDTVKLVKASYLGWREVSAEVNDDMNGIDFVVKGKKKDLIVTKNDLGYEYLFQQFPDKVKAAQDFVDAYHDPISRQ